MRAHGVKTRLGGGGELWMDGSGVIQQSLGGMVVWCGGKVVWGGGEVRAGGGELV